MLRSFLRPTHRVARQLSASAEKRPFKILGLQQVAVGALDKAALSHFWTDVLGCEKVSSYRSDKENVDEDILTIGRGLATVEIDLMQPINPDVAPKVHAPALNHIGLWVDDLHACVAHLSARGVVFTPGGIRKGAAGHEVAFVHPKSAVGVLLELVQAPPDVVAGLR